MYEIRLSMSSSNQYASILVPNVEYNIIWKIDNTADVI